MIKKFLAWWGDPLPITYRGFESLREPWIPVNHIMRSVRFVNNGYADELLDNWYLPTDHRLSWYEGRRYYCNLCGVMYPLRRSTPLTCCAFCGVGMGRIVPTKRQLEIAF